MSQALRTLLISGLLALPVPLPAQAPPSAQEDGAALLNRLKLEFDIARAELVKPLAQLDELYRGQLEGLKAAAQDGGRLEELLAVRAEMARLDGMLLEEAGTDFGELVRLRGIYAEAKAGRSLQSRRLLLPLIEKQTALLEELRTFQTRENRIDEALRTQAELDRLAHLEEETRRALEGQEAAPRGPSPVSPRSPLSPPTPAPGARHLKVRVQVDGMGHLHLQGSEIWFDHSRGRAARPGLHEGVFPTYLDDATEWMPVWRGNLTERFDAGIDLSEGRTPLKINLRFSKGRGTAEVVQQPSEENAYTAVVEVRDETREGRTFNGSDWMEFRLTW